MPTYTAPVADTLFVLNDVLSMQRHANLPGFSDATPDIVEAVLSESARVAQDILLPLNAVGDAQGCTRHADGSVTTPAGFKAAYEAWREGGWGALSADPDFGGQGLPHTLATAVSEFMSSANMAFAMYPGLTAGAIAAISAHGDPAQKKAYLPAMIEGTWTGTMNLTEPHCGTDLGLLRTRAVPQDDGRFSISGQKIFISAGEHDLSDNVIHLVLARIEGAPAGVKGISLFVVPKFLLDESGRPGARNAVSCGALEEKMGIHGNATCVMNYDGATGFLLGEAHKGLRAMFTMMNEARLGVGVQGLAVSEIAYQNAVAYARERRQGRAANDGGAGADPIIVHPDVRRMLMTIRAVNEAGRALILDTALKGDLSHRSPDAAERQAADDRMGLLTPVIKGVLTDRGFDNCVLAQQVFGGHGYIREWGMEQFVRDARIAQIYEGANGIQALDLVGRKLAMNGGRALQAFIGEVGRFCEENRADEAMAPLTKALKKGLDDLGRATAWLMQNGMSRPQDAGAAATDYMHLLGLVALGHMSARMAKVAGDKLAEGGEHDAAFLEAKRVTARFFMDRLMPETAAHLARLSTGASSMMALDAAAF
ncbi:acyl-CoA dehydrogenase C-terminal domain-containing protein [Aurantimonas sp. Leaf443]|uniref:acyl-CoA dehydrogenase C-terminal domain-containing protein n=1 Tax=Aurantimonas sp. Leaf443 TaxID=1736378 RepID=UPI0006F60198|nr:acyl-CoA dehydrogenase C-terminal domain-containing protein [Aurantimonas sp. Leaf443]KQT86361.1 acyl-CoA dehydrogenase [Aurantimonas sp. Leaf443]